MQNLNFRLKVEGLDERCLPSVTPDMVHIALVHQAAVHDELLGVVEHLNDPKTAQTLAFLPTHLRERANSSQTDFNILADHLSSLQAQLAANPSQATTLNPLIGTIAMAEYQASINIVFAEFYARAYGAPARVPPPSPPSIDNGVNFGNTGLPFSLTDPGFVTIANGVRTLDVTAGTGTTLATGTQFTARYTGYLTNGTIFDSSTKSGNLSGTVGSNLIAGFSAGLVGMKVGGVRRIDIPASQAYGANPPAGSVIPPNAELVFEVTLLSSP